MSYIVVDVETDGPVQGKNSIVCFGAVVVEPTLTKTFYGRMKPISDTFNPDALAVSGFSREEHLTFDEPDKVMKDFAIWISENSIGRPILISDNNGYDSAWINWYFYVYYGSNPFGWTSRRIGDLFCGAEHDLHYSWKKHRKTTHNHNPVFDSMGNAEALLYFFEKYKIKLPK
jgi:DNA polymerase III alpha subunit (gram-positive type)